MQAAIGPDRRCEQDGGEAAERAVAGAGAGIELVVGDDVRPDGDADGVEPGIEATSATLFASRPTPLSPFSRVPPPDVHADEAGGRGTAAGEQA